jgi:CRP/FNR family transcriptional regulator
MPPNRVRSVDNSMQPLTSPADQARQIQQRADKTVGPHEAWTGHANCRNCSIRQSVLFAGLEEADFEKIHEPIDQFSVKPGGFLYRAGEQGRNMFTIRSGAVKLVQYLTDGSQRIVRLARTTDVIGQETLLDNDYQHHAVALYETEVCRYPASLVLKLQKENPKLHREMMERWQQALNQADAWLTELSTGPAKQRVARLLLRLVDTRCDNHCSLFSREDLGAMLGITTETASRIIAEFKRAGFIRKDSNGGIDLAADKLREIANA